MALALFAFFPGDCGDSSTGWTCDGPGYAALYGGGTATAVLAILLMVGLWRSGRSFARRFAKPS